MLKNKVNFIFFILIFWIYSCQKIETLDKVAFNYEQLPTFVVSAEKMKIVNLYEAKFTDPYFDHSMTNPPVNILNEWFEKNINTLGAQNKFEINIIDASLKKTEIPNTSSKKYKEKTIFLYEVNFLTEFVLYDDSNNILGSSVVEAKSTTTSGKYISIQESENIIDSLVFNCLIDFANKAEELINMHLKNYIL
tara:strand:- start:1586 stop:2164 length:579 start_codon:yes stop_codon:yes gene_type:complete